jgi:hypothetical protein
MAKVLLGDGAGDRHTFTPKSQCSFNAVTVIIRLSVLDDAMNIGNLQGRAISFCWIPPRVVVNQSQVLAHVIATHPPVIAGKGMDPEPIRGARIDPDREAAVARRMTRTWREDLVTIDVSMQMMSDGSEVHSSSSPRPMRSIQ